MTDHFALLGQERRPWLDAEAVKEAFHRRSAESHPDVPGSGDAGYFAELNAAYTVLRDPASRLRHLLELTSPEAATGQAPPPAELGDLFMRIGAMKRRLDALAAAQSAAGSPLARALLAGEEAAARRELSAVRDALDAALAAADAELRELDGRWAGDETAELVHLYHRLAYLGRWQAQSREAALRWET